MNNQVYTQALDSCINFPDHEVPTALSVGGITKKGLKYVGAEVKARLGAFNLILLYLRHVQAMDINRVTRGFVISLITDYDVLVDMIRDVLTREDVEFAKKATLLKLRSWFYCEVSGGTWTVKPKQRNVPVFVFVIAD